MYGFTFAVIVIVSRVRPWNALSKTTTAGRPVAERAILTAFSTASAPELRRSDFCSLARARRELGQPAAHLDVGLVDADHEALVEVLVGLGLDRVDDGREPVPGVLAADAAGEVDERAPVDVGDARAVGVRDDELRDRDAGAHVLRPIGEDAVVGGDLGGGVHRVSMTQLQRRFHAVDPRIAQLECQFGCLMRVRRGPISRYFVAEAKCGCPHCGGPRPCATIAHVTQTVLIVDDHPSFRASARAILEADGFSIVGEAEDGATGLALLRRLRPDVVLLDVQLPDMSGFDVCVECGDLDTTSGRARLEPRRDRLRLADRVERGPRLRAEGRSLRRGDHLADRVSCR